MILFVALVLLSGFVIGVVMLSYEAIAGHGSVG